MSGIILLDDDFCSIVNAVKWGRNVFDVARKYLQYQLTVIIVASFMVVIGCLWNKESPLTPFQMIWINLINEFSASLVLLSEKPSSELLKKKPEQVKDSLVTKNMWRFICCEGIVQIIILCGVLFKGKCSFYLGHDIFGVPSSIGMK